jgi:hypothetical protein
MKIPSLETAAAGYPVTRDGVSFFPVYTPALYGPLIATGPNAGVVIEERPNASVPTLVVRNDTATPVLLVEGETVVGGLQNRVLNVSVLVPAGSTIEVPVSCVEQGRWGERTAFGRGRTHATRRVRRDKTRSVVESVERGNGKNSDQGAVWTSVHQELNRLGVNDPTSALARSEDVFLRDDRRARGVDELVAMGPLPGQNGIVISHGSRIVAADVFATPDALACHWEAIIRSHMLDAPDRVSGRPSLTRAVRFLRRLAVAEHRIAPGVGLGREHHVSTDKLVGQALVWDDVLIHASAFALAA